MAIMQWSDNLSVHVGIFDMHHKKLVDLINTLHDAMLGGKTKDIVSGILKSLLDYTQYHFTEEERRMTAHNYPNYSEHKSQHDNFVNKIKESIVKYEAGTTLFTVSLLNFLVDWLRKHIMGTDKKYSGFFADKETG
ncbi:MAG: hemerythrin family protein [Deltaproteobacteria bacterium]|nr:hemerythrin family protein [Deltaproteobacteria bacterium]